MEPKYYTPGPEEFYLGFEYEEFDRRHVCQTHDGWSTRRIYCGTSLCNLSTRFFEQLNDGKYRVKYLDIEDIKALGFECINSSEENTELYTTGEAKFYNKIKGKTVYIKYSYEIVQQPVGFTRKAEVIIKSGYPEVSYEDAKSLPIKFRGTVKNKSELKRLLKQLGIHNEQENSTGTDMS